MLTSRTLGIHSNPGVIGGSNILPIVRDLILTTWERKICLLVDRRQYPLPLDLLYNRMRAQANLSNPLKTRNDLKNPLLQNLRAVKNSPPMKTLCFREHMMISRILMTTGLSMHGLHGLLRYLFCVRWQ